ncbi:hypothetical protein PVAP13_4KG367400 [Panicum virgatum]|uniref:Uncharacterized protein n=1 Tax=Panicum virgatum TaxID=38727 RepID=A0A8T0TU21_PANVG|nr:hypothetical protein PVAP13_4KG367400 [Panicum virgatum]
MATQLRPALRPPVGTPAHGGLHAGAGVEVHHGRAAGEVRHGRAGGARSRWGRQRFGLSRAQSRWGRCRFEPSSAPPPRRGARAGKEVRNAASAMSARTGGDQQVEGTTQRELGGGREGAMEAWRERPE